MMAPMTLAPRAMTSILPGVVSLPVATAFIRQTQFAVVTTGYGEAIAVQRPNAQTLGASITARTVDGTFRALTVGVSSLALAGFNGDGMSPLGQLAVGAFLLSATLYAIKYFGDQRANRASAREYFGEKYGSAVDDLRTSEPKHRGWRKDDVQILEKAAGEVRRVINLGEAERVAAIDGLIDWWEAYSGGACYSTYLTVGAPARALAVLAERIPDSFTRAQYVRMANVGRNGVVPVSGCHIQRAAEFLEPKFGALKPTEVVTKEQETSGAIVEALTALEATGGVAKEDLDMAASGGAGLGVTMAALVMRNRQIKGDLGRKSRTGLIRTGKDRIREFKVPAESKAGLDDAQEEGIIAKQTGEMVGAVLSRAQQGVTKGQEAVAELLEELTKVYPGAASAMSLWLMLPMLKALGQLARERPELFQSEGAMAELAKLRALKDAPTPPVCSRELEGILQATTAPAAA